MQTEQIASFIEKAVQEAAKEIGAEVIPSLQPEDMKCLHMGIKVFQKMLPMFTKMIMEEYARQKGAN
jgi:hypothetical protein